MRFCCSLLLLGMLALTPSLARAQPASSMTPEAKRHLQRGLRDYNLQDYDAAIAEFKAGYQIDPQPDFLFAIAQAQRLQGDCAHALLSYQAFLRAHPSSRQVGSTNEMIRQCQAAMQAQAPATPPPATAAPPPAPTTAARAPERLRPRYVWYKDWIGDTLVLAGVAGLVAGGVLYAGGHSAITNANGAPSYDDFVSQSQAAAGASDRQTGGIVALAAGGALVAAGVLDFALRTHADHRRARAGVAAVFTPGGAMIMATRRF